MGRPKMGGKSSVRAAGNRQEATKMAGDWLAIRLDLFDDPAVVSISTALGIDPDSVVGKLTKLWSWANRHLHDGVAKGITTAWIDQYVSVVGFASAMCETGWLKDGHDSVVFPKFDNWNSKSAKQRLLAARRKHKERVRKPCHANVTEMSRSQRDKNVTREEKRREENIECVSNITETSPVETHTHNSSKGLTEAERIHRSYCLRRWGDSWDADQESAKSLKEIREIESRLEAMPSARSKLEAYFANPPPWRLATEPLYQIFQYLELDQKNAEKKQSQRTTQPYKDFTAERLASQFKA